MHACAVGFIMQRHKPPIAQGSDAVASTLFSSHLPQVERFYARYQSHDGMLNSVPYCDNMQSEDLPICLGL